MAKLPIKVTEVWEQRDGPVVLVTVGSDGIANAIYVKSVQRYGEDIFLIADNYFQKTRVNLLSQSHPQGALLFISKDGTAIQLKGKLEYYDSGDFFADMKKWNPSKHPGHGVAVLRVSHAFSGGEQLV